MSPTKAIEDRDAFAVECEAYRERHGRNALTTYVGRGGFYVCAHADSQEAVLVQLRTHTQVTFTAAEFADEFSVYLMDEGVFWFGSQAAQAAAKQLQSDQLAACRHCIALARH